MILSSNSTDFLTSGCLNVSVHGQIASLVILQFLIIRCAFHAGHTSQDLDLLRKTPPAEPAAPSAPAAATTAPSPVGRKSPVSTRPASTNTQKPVDLLEQRRGENQDGRAHTLTSHSKFLFIYLLLGFITGLVFR